MLHSKNVGINNKPDFHLHLSPVVSEFFCIEHGQIGETNGKDEKISLALFTFKPDFYSCISLVASEIFFSGN